MGAVTPIGLNLDTTWANMLAGENGISRISLFDPTDFLVQIAGQVLDWDPQKYTPIFPPRMTRKSIPWMNRATQMGLKSAHSAVIQSRLDTHGEHHDLGGIWVGNGGGGMGEFYDISTKINDGRHTRVKPSTMVRALTNMNGAWLARLLGMVGPTQNVQSACASSIDALATAASFITSPWYPKVKYAVVVGAEAAIDPCNCAGFATTGALNLSHNDDPAHASCPFSANHDGFVAAEGSGAVVLEDEQFAYQRGAKPLARVRWVNVQSKGGGEGLGETEWTTNPNVEFCTTMIHEGLEFCRWEPQTVQAWIAHGTSTPTNDVSETEVIKRSFGNHAYEILIPAIKSMLGHGLGASGIWNIIVGVMAIQTGRIPPTINLETLAEGCDLNYVPNGAIAEIIRCIAAAMGFGDQNAFAFLERFEDWEL